MAVVEVVFRRDHGDVQRVRLSQDWGLFAVVRNELNQPEWRKYLMKTPRNIANLGFGRSGTSMLAGTIAGDENASD